MERNKKLMIFFGAALGVILIIKFAVFVPLKRIRVLNRLIPVKEKDAKELLLLKKEYCDLIGQLQRVEMDQVNKTANLDKKKWIEQTAGTMGLHLEKIEEKNNNCQIVITELNLKGILKFLYEIEQPESAVIIKTVRISKEKGLTLRSDLEYKN